MKRSLFLLFFLCAWCFVAPAPGRALDLLRVSPGNPRYFMDLKGDAVFLSGSHTWSDLQDVAGTSHMPPVFDFSAYMRFLNANNHNFTELWGWEEASYWTADTNKVSISPNVYQRTGPEKAIDGKPKFDLTRFDQTYFDRLRGRVSEADAAGIYTAIILFNGFSVDNKSGTTPGNPWPGHPFNKSNNINSVDGDPGNTGFGTEIHRDSIPSITNLQKAYVAKVIDTVNDFNNVLYEVCNECNSASMAWQNLIADYIHSHEAAKPKQHPVGITTNYPDGSNAELFVSHADYVCPGDAPGNQPGLYSTNPPPTDGSKIVVADTDHVFGIGGDRIWAWKSFTRGMNLLFMDPYNGSWPGWSQMAAKWVSLRSNLGYIRDYANRVNLIALRPLGGLSGSGYALANPSATDAEYLVFLPSGGSTTVDLAGSPGSLSVEWFHPANGETVGGSTVTGGGPATFTSPFGSDDCVLYLKTQAAPASQYTVRVIKKGVNRGTVSSSPRGIHCGNSCSKQSASFSSGAIITLTASAASGSSFDGWTSALCGGEGQCVFSVSGDVTVTASFSTRKSFTLNAAKRKKNKGDGLITSGDYFIQCGSACRKSYPEGTAVSLTAAADLSTSSTFTGWQPASPGCAGTGSCDIIMDKPKAVGAVFVGPQMLTVYRQKLKKGDGVVTSNANPNDGSYIDCGTTCRVGFPLNFQVTLTAKPAGDGSAFVGWMPASLGCADPTCTVVMDKNLSVRAVFAK